MFSSYFYKMKHIIITYENVPKLIHSKTISRNFPKHFIHFVFLGAAFTRFQTLRLQKIFPEVLADQLISYGSCQFPTLGFVVERYKQVQAFVSEPFWKIRGN